MRLPIRSSSLNIRCLCALALVLTTSLPSLAIAPAPDPLELHRPAFMEQVPRNSKIWFQGEVFDGAFELGLCEAGLEQCPTDGVDLTFFDCADLFDCAFAHDPGPLTADTEYEMVVDDGAGQRFTAMFQTLDVVDDDAPAAPRFSASVRTGRGTTARYNYVDIDLVASSLSTDVVAVRLLQDGTAVRTAMIEEGGITFSRGAPTRDTEACFEVVAIDLAGNESDVSDEVCTTLRAVNDDDDPAPAGCADTQARARPSLSLLAACSLLMLFVPLRRRRRTAA